MMNSLEAVYVLSFGSEQLGYVIMAVPLCDSSQT